MKRSTLIILLMLLSSTAMMAQSTVLEGRVIGQNDVPQAVVNRQTTQFPDAKVIKWKLQKATGVRGNSAERYVAVFKLGKRPLSNAKYKPDGTLLFFSEYYGPRTIPEIIKPDLSKNFSGHNITSGVHIKLYERQKEYYRIRLKKGAQLTYVFYDKEGNQVDRSTLPKDADFN